MADSPAGISYEYHAANHEASHAYLKPVVDRLLTHIPAGARVLDLGCGNGTFLSLYRDRGWFLHGTDFSSTGIEIARHHFPDIDFFLSDAQTAEQVIREHVGQANVILSTEVIEHLYDPRAFLRTAFSLLTPGGTLILTTPYHGYLKNLMLALTGKMDQHFTVLWDHGHIKFWSPKTLTQALTEAGFTSIHVAGSGRIPWLWKSMVVSCTRPR